MLFLINYGITSTLKLYMFINYSFWENMVN
jgi:hypothetical protein